MKKLDNRKEYIKNHFVPKFYLKHFTRENEPEIINVTDLLRNKTYPKNISEVGYEEYLNTVDYEIHINKYEKKYDETIRKIKELIAQRKLWQQIPSDLLNEITDMVAFIQSHSPFWREYVVGGVSNLIMEKHNIRLPKVDYRSKDTIAIELFDFWKKELYNWTIIVIGNSEIAPNYITSDFPVVVFSLHPDLKTFNNLTTHLEGSLGYDKNNTINVYGGINAIDDNAAFVFPVTSDTLIMGFKNDKAFDSITQAIDNLVSNLESHKIHRVFTNLSVLAAARKYVCSKSQDDLKEINKYIRGFQNPFMFSPYDPYIE